MLPITVPDTKLFDEGNSEIIQVKETTLQLEHSLVSLSKWESKWCKPFLSKEDKTPEETLDYIKCMTLNKSVDPNVYLALTHDNVYRITKYIEHPMTATTISETAGAKGKNKIVTSELIYYWMISLGIPFECKKWHLNQLLMLIKVCNAENNPKKQKNTKQTALDYATLNAERKKKRLEKQQKG